MNGWDLFTWISATGLALAVAVIFLLFLVHAREVLNGIGGEDE